MSRGSIRGILTFGAALAFVVTGGMGAPTARGDRPPFVPLELTFIHHNGAIRAVRVLVRASERHAYVTVSVRRRGELVFQRDGRTRTIPGASGPTGLVARSRWRTVLRTSAWRGGCRHAHYVISATVDYVRDTASSFVCR